MPQILHLWLDSDFYLPNSETSPFSRQTVVVDQIKAPSVFKLKNFKRFGVVGGASANLNLRKRLETLCQKNECELLLAPLEFCSDNALMIARAGREKYLKGEFVSHSELNINPRVSFKKLELN